MPKKPLEKIITEVKEFKEDAEEQMRQVKEVINDIETLEDMKNEFIDEMESKQVGLVQNRELKLRDMLGKIEGSHIEKGAIKAIINGLIS